MVLTKGFDERGIVFFTNYGSRKAGELEANPHAALLFHWPELGRQVRIEGAVSRVPRAETEAYARSRSRQSQLSALASPQSQPVPSREWLEQRVAELDREHAGAELPVREDWGGYRLAPGGLGVLAAPPQPPARPLPLPARGAAPGGSSGSGPSAAAVREGLDRDAVVALAHAQLVGGAAVHAELGRRAAVALDAQVACRRSSS